MPKDTYKLPDGTLIDMGIEKARAPEILFSPDSFGHDFPCN
jgi:hypothetical protein